MFQKKISKITFNITAAIMLLTSTVSFAFAAPPLQTGDQGNQSGQPSQDQEDQFQQGQQGQDQQGQQDQFQQGQQDQQGTGTGQQGFQAGQGNVSLVCSQTQVVQDDNELSEIADRFFTNAQNVDTVILCVPAQQGTGTGQQGQFQQGQQGTGSTADQTFNLAPGQGMVIVENVSAGDIIFDISNPGSAGSSWIGPSQQQQFALPTGTYNFMGHHPLGDFAVAPGQVQVLPGQVTRLSCSTSLCQPVLSQQGQQQNQQGQFQQGQQQGQQDQFQQGQSQQNTQPQADDNSGGSSGNGN